MIYISIAADDPNQMGNHHRKFDGFKWLFDGFKWLGSGYSNDHYT